MKKLIWVGLVVVLSAAGWWYYSRDGEAAESPYRFATVERGHLEATIAATGTLSAVTTVEVGTQVSGRIEKIFVDFNDRVSRGQLIARIDATLLEQNVRDAEARLERSQAELDHRQREFDRNKTLFDNKVITETEFNTIRYSLDLARADLKSAEISLERARQNLSYTVIYAPIDGVVVERNVDVGQTVAASLSAPQLFLIANDLSRMEILASVDESDIGQIEEGQAVRFTVQAYPEDQFFGKVRQVRLQSTMQENVVNYTVVIDVENQDGRLLPGMTATVDFLIESVDDILMVSNAALRFRPTQEMIDAVRASREERQQQLPDSVRQRIAERRAGGNGGGFQRTDFTGGGPREGFQRPPNAETVWYLDEEGRVAVARVRAGITDGRSTEITGPSITEGMNVITAALEGTQPANNNPFQGQTQRFRPGGF
jgi:HlyD family secretion protein